MRKFSKLLFVAFGLTLTFGPKFAVAQQSFSNSYGADEVFMGPGGSNDVSSSNYTGRASIGDAALTSGNTGNGSSTNNQTYSGNTTTANPELEVTLSAASLDMGVFSPNAPGTGTATFSVRTYLASGYVVYTIGNPPTSSSGRQLAPMTTGGTSSPGTEQFGINLVANTTPAIGSNLSQGEFGVGYVATNYATANNFRYNTGEVIARADSSSGLTTYTISYLININPATTPAGRYIFTQSIVVTSTY